MNSMTFIEKGNTDSFSLDKPTPTQGIEEHKARSRFRSACFTLNNWTNDEMNSMILDFELFGYKYIFGEEIAPTTGTPHLQGYVEFGKQVYFTHLKKLSARANWRKCRGSRAQNVTYCTKEGRGIKTNLPTPIKERVMSKLYSDVTWKPWQQNIVDICDTEPDSRTIYWVWEPIGNVGKSFLVKYLFMKHNAIIGDGKKADVFNQVKTWMDEREEESPRLIILDVPRHNIDYVNYGSIEQIKNGLLYSGKYEGGTCLYEFPHVFIFANTPPDLAKMSLDRWVVMPIGPER